MTERVRLRPAAHLRHIARLDNETLDRAACVRLDKNENLYPLPVGFLRALRRRFTATAMSSYPQPHLLQAALARTLRLPAEQLYLTAGSDAGIKHVFEVFARPGRPVVMLEPTYAMYRVYAELFRTGVRTAGYDLRLRPDLQRFEKLISRRCSMVVVANPNSPTGTGISPLALARIVRRAAAQGVPVLIDEAYYPYYPHTALPLLRRYGNVIITRTFSKAHGLAGARLGLIIARAPLLALLRKWRPMYEVNAFAVTAGMVMLGQQAWLRRIVRRTVADRRWAVAWLRRRGIPVIDTQANFLHVGVGRAAAARLVRRLRTRHILVRENGAPEALRGYLRLTVGPRALLLPVLRLLAEHADRA